MSIDKNYLVGHEDVLRESEVDVRSLGYVGLTVGPLRVREALSGGTFGNLVLPSDYVYAPDGDYRSWVAGPVAENGGHITAKYGLLKPSKERVGVINRLVGDVTGMLVTVTGIEVFPSPYGDLPYDCIVALVEGGRLRDINVALSLLPHIDTYATYRPHLTLAYLTPGLGSRVASQAAEEWLVGKRIHVTGIDYGD